MNVGSIKDYNIKEIKPSLDFEIGSIGINTFQISHDAINPIGYSFNDNGKKYSIVTDTGIITDGILKSIQTRHIINKKYFKIFYAAFLCILSGTSR